MSTSLLKLGTLISVSLLFPLSGGASAAAQDTGRPLAVEDYYDLQTISSPVISPDGAWVAYALVSRIEENNSSPSEVWVARTDGSADPRRISPAGVDAGRPSWGSEGLLRYVSGERAFSVGPSDEPGPRAVLQSEALDVIPSPDGGMFASLQAAEMPLPQPNYASDFERRHEERFDGRAWDWMYFQRDRQPLPTVDPTDPAATPPLEVAISTGPGAPARTPSRVWDCALAA